VKRYQPEDYSAPHHRGIIAWWARNPVAANLMMVAILIAGAIGYTRLDREVFPSADINIVTVGVAWPGAAPREVEEQIILRIEESLADLDNIDNVVAIASEGFANVQVTADRGVDMTAFVDEVKLRVDAVNNLPRDSYPPQVSQARSTQQFMGMVIYGDVDRRLLQRVAREVRDEVSTLPGASLTQVQAALPEEVSIEVSEESMRRYGLTFSDVAQAIRNASLNASAGNVRTDLGDVALTSRELADTPEEFADIVVRQTASGARIRVADIANVDDGFGDADFDGEYNGQDMTFVFISTPEHVNVVETSKAVRAYLEEKVENLPPGVNIRLWWDDSRAYASRMKTIANDTLQGLIMVFIVLMLTLRPGVAIWTTVGIAISFAGGAALLPYFGVSLNMLSLFAVLLVSGILVDDAIVIGENIHNQVESGKRHGLDAAVIGTQMVAKPVIFAVLTMMVAFAPWMLLTGPEVQFTRQISLVVIFALMFSLIEALLILPAHLSHLRPQREGGRLMRFQQRIADSLVRFARNVYRPIAMRLVKVRYITVSVFFGIFLVALGLQTTGWLPFQMMPNMEGEFIQARIQLPPGTPFSRSQTIKTLVESASAEVSARYEELYGDEKPMILSTVAMAQNGSVQAYIEVAPANLRPGNVPTSEVADQVRAALGPIPDAEEIFFSASFNDESTSVSYAVSSSDLEDLRVAVEELKAQLATYNAVYDITDDMQTVNEELRFTLKPDAQSVGVTLGMVTQQVRQAYYGEEVQRLPRDGQDVRVMVRYPEEIRRSLDSLNNLRIRTTDGREVPLYSVADVEFAPGVQRIIRRDRMRSARVSAEVPTEVRGDVMKDLDTVFLPAWQERHPNIVLGALGDNEAEQEFLQEIIILQIMMLGTMYILLAVAFKSYLQPLLIMTAIPFAVAGAYFGHVLFGMPLALFSYFGIGAAAGVVINDNLVLIEFVNRLRASGLGAYQALIEAATSRFRPIVLTAVTSFVGTLPMAMQNDWQAQFLKPMVISLSFGILFALFLTLLMTPSLYGIGCDISRFARGLWTGVRQKPFGSSWDEERAFSHDPDEGFVPAGERPAIPDGHAVPAE
jgi:multidrug efflux pump subunit AcrB